MAIKASKNIVNPGARLNFAIGGNLVPKFDIGKVDGDDYWLNGFIAPDDEFLFNGRIFMPQISENGTIIDSFPKGPAPEGWTKEMIPNGLSLVRNGITLFGFRVVDGVTCYVITNLFARDGQLVAEATDTDLIVYRAPMNLGGGAIVVSE